MLHAEFGVVPGSTSVFLNVQTQQLPGGQTLQPFIQGQQPLAIGGQQQVGETTVQETGRRGGHAREQKKESGEEHMDISTSSSPTKGGRRSSNGKMSREEAGRRGAEARWGKESGGEDEDGGRLTRSQAAKKASAARWGKDEADVGSGGEEGGTLSRSEAGRRGGQARQQQMRERGEQPFGGMSPSKAGKRGAEARWSEEPEEKESGGSPSGRQNRSQAGRKGGLARQHQMRQQGEQPFGGMSPSEAGKKGAEARWSAEPEEKEGDGSPSGRLTRSQAGRKGGLARQEQMRQRGEEPFGGQASAAAGRRKGAQKRRSESPVGTQQAGRRGAGGKMSKQEAGHRGGKARWYGSADEADDKMEQNGGGDQAPSSGRGHNMRSAGKFVGVGEPIRKSAEGEDLTDADREYYPFAGEEDVKDEEYKPTGNEGVVAGDTVERGEIRDTEVEDILQDASYAQAGPQSEGLRPAEAVNPPERFEDVWANPDYAADNREKSAGGYPGFEQAGRKGAAARWAKERKQIGAAGGQQAAQAGGTMSRQEAGRRGGKARWGHDIGDEGQEDEEGGKMSRQEAGRRGGKARWGQDIGDEGQEDQEGGKMSRQEAGRRGGKARWGQHVGDEGDEGQEERGKMSRQKAGQKGAEARWGGEAGAGGDYEVDLDDEGGTLSRSEAGRRGGQARQQQMRQQGEQPFGGLSPSEAGHRGGQAGGRKGGQARQQQMRQQGEQPFGGLSPSEAGHKGGLARQQQMREQGEQPFGGLSPQEAGRRGGKASGGGFGSQEDMDVDEEGGTLSRSEAGRRGGQARQQQMRERGDQPFGGVDPLQAGRKGAEARWGKESGATQEMDEELAGGGSHIGGRQLREIEDLRELARWYGYEDVGESGSGQDGRLTRSQAGQKGAAARWGKEGLEPTGTGVGQRGGMSRQEAGKKGAEARFGGKTGQQGEDLDTDQNQKGQMFGKQSVPEAWDRRKPEGREQRLAPAAASLKDLRAARMGSSIWTSTSRSRADKAAAVAAPESCRAVRSLARAALQLRQIDVLSALRRQATVAKKARKEPTANRTWHRRRPPRARSSLATICRWNRRKWLRLSILPPIPPSLTTPTKGLHGKWRTTAHALRLNSFRLQKPVYIVSITLFPPADLHHVLASSHSYFCCPSKLFQKPHGMASLRSLSP